jgi:hypothetical protein
LLKSNECSDGLFISIIREQPEEVEHRLHAGTILAEGSNPCLGPLLAGGEDVEGSARFFVDKSPDYSCKER